MTIKEYRELIKSDNPDEVKYVKGTDLESVEPTYAEKIINYTCFCLTRVGAEGYNDTEELKAGNIFKRLNAIMEKGELDSMDEAYERFKRQTKDAPLFEKWGYSSVDELLERNFKVFFDKAEGFVATREENFNRAILPYIQDMLIAGMRAKLLACVWIRLEGYGFSVSPFAWEKGKSYVREDLKDFPYKSVSEMPEKDRKAFESLSLDVLYEISSHVVSYGCTRKAKRKDPGEPESEILLGEPYPKEGLEEAELVALHRYEDNKDASDDEIYSSLFDSWETEPELYLPILYNRYDEALYYALKYSGNEYKRYIESLNVEADWNAGLWNCEGGADKSEIRYDKLF